MKIEKPYDATRVVALRRMVIDLDTLDYIICQFDFRKLKNVVNTAHSMNQNASYCEIPCIIFYLWHDYCLYYKCI